jgi:hypothetical protein
MTERQAPWRTLQQLRSAFDLAPGNDLGLKSQE